MSPEEYLDKVNEECNTFLKTRVGLQYLMMKYPTKSLVVAIENFKKMAQKNLKNKLF